jgi:hypothetical protein
MGTSARLPMLELGGRTAVDVVMGAADVMVVCEIGLVVTWLATALHTATIDTQELAK